jgi:ABC-type glycerol-3-phosphate transport system substrate-binding protein
MASATGHPGPAHGATVSVAYQDDPLNLVYHSWPIGTELLPPYLEIFTEQYGDTVELSVVPKDYHQTTETRLQAEADMDVLVADEGYPAKWLQAGWITDVEGLPGLDRLMEEMVPSALEASQVGGKMVALPGSGLTKVMVYNAEVLTSAGLEPAETWDEFYEQCVSMKEESQALYPFVPMWTKAYGLATYFLMGDSYSRGANDWFEPETLSPTYDSDPAVLETLEFWKMLWDGGLVPPDVLTVDHNATTAIFGAGDCAYFQHNLSQSAFPLNTQPDNFAVAGNIELMLYPGTTHECLTGWNVVSMTPRQDRDRVWALERFLGGTDKNDEYLIPAKWRAIDMGEEVPYTPVLSDPEVQAALGEWVNTTVLAEQQERGRLMGPIVQASWFGEWLDKTTADVQNAIIGSISPSDALKSSADFARSKATA